MRPVLTPGSWSFVLSTCLLAGCAGATLDADFADTKADAARDAASTHPGVSHPRTGAFSPVSEAGWSQASWPQGARFVDGEGSDLEVAVYSAHATRVLLEIYPAATGSGARYDYWMERGADNLWRARVADVPGKSLYAFRVWGPNWTYDPAWKRGGSQVGFIADVDAQGNRFNPNKVLFDPYARELSHDKSTPALVARGLDGKMYGTGDATYQGAPRRMFDTGPWAPKAVAMVDETPSGARPAVAAKDAVIYEAHVRGLSAHPTSAHLTEVLDGVAGFEGVVDVPEACRGTYRAAA